MQTKAEVETIVSNMAHQIKAELGEKLNSVILYGSYARGDFEEYSDVDVMVLVNTPHEHIKKYWDTIVNIAIELGWENNLLISPVIQSIEIFEKYKEASGFYKSVIAEGVQISA